MLNDLFHGLKIERTIDHLRRVHGGQWRYEAHELGKWLQVNTGRRVYRCGTMVGPSDDDFASQLRWLDTGERAEYSCARCVREQASEAVPADTIAGSGGDEKR